MSDKKKKGKTTKPDNKSKGTVSNESQKPDEAATPKNEDTGAENNKDTADQDTIELSTEDILLKQVNELNDKYIRLFSEFDNFRKRSIREKLEMNTTASADMISALLPVVDDFERGMKSMEETNDIGALKEGVKLIQEKLAAILRQKGLEPMDSIGKDFDTDYHEAISKIPAPSDDMKGKVIDVVEKGYTLKDKVLRYAKVVIGS